MTDLERATYATAEQDSRRRSREPFVTPLDVAAFVMIVLMIWGPLAAGALRH